MSKQFKFSWDYSNPIFNQLICSPIDEININNFRIDNRPVGFYIKKVTYFLDGKKVATAKKEPFNLHYKPSRMVWGVHEIKAEVVIQQIPGPDLKTSISIPLYVVADKPSMAITWSPTWETPIMNVENVAHNGNILKFMVSFNKMLTKGVELEKAEFYWDDKLIDTTTSFPYEIMYKLENETIGKHRLSGKYTAKWQYGTIVLDMTKEGREIIITE